MSGWGCECTSFISRMGAVAYKNFQAAASAVEVSDQIASSMHWATYRASTSNIGIFICELWLMTLPQLFAETGHGEWISTRSWQHR